MDEELNHEVIYPRSKYLPVPLGPLKEGLVDNINPALEKVFELLQRDPKQKRIVIELHFGDYPTRGNGLLLMRMNGLHGPKLAYILSYGLTWIYQIWWSDLEAFIPPSSRSPASIP